MATYAVGDIQGCLPSLKALLKSAKFSKYDNLWCAGDLVNRGPQSLETLRFIKGLGKRAKVVLGNHDLHLLACWHGNKKRGSKDTLDDVLLAPDAEELLNWLIQQPLIHRDKKLGYAMVHAGIPPQWSLKQAIALAKEVEAALQSDSAWDFFDEMYGNTPDIWSDELQGTERLRVITNYLTRMRFCKMNGALEFNSKCPPNTPPTGYLPWYAFKNHRCKKKNILFGHWAAMMGETGVDNFIGLDTGCVWGGKLTMMRLEDGEFFNVECEC